MLKTIGRVLRIEAFMLLLPAGVSLFYGGEAAWTFVAAAALAITAGQGLYTLKPKILKLKYWEGYVVAAATWLALAVFAAIPYFFSGCYGSYVDCFFEATAGLTTTGASALSDIEALPESVTFWRALTQWIGGMGVLVLMIALTPPTSTSASSINLLKAEAPGVESGKIVPRMRDTATILYAIYLCLTAILFVILLIGGMNPYEAAVHAMGTAGTGGAAPLNSSLGGYARLGGAVRWAVMVGMFLCGINFNVLYALIKGNFKAVIKDEELRAYFFTALAGAVLITINIRGMCAGFGEAATYGAFHSVSFLTTTGYFITDFTKWPAASRAIIIVLMLIGGCAGSTAGGMKIARIRLLFKAVKHEMLKIIHPRAVRPIVMNGKLMPEHITTQVLLYCAAYGLMLVGASIVVAFDVGSLSAAVSSAISMLSNIEPGFGVIGPAGAFGGYGSFSPITKIVLTFCMIAGRLGFYPVFVLFMPGMWRGKS
jgi:trk system potassium uptake protein TrkH